MVDAQGRDGAKLCSSRLGTQTEPQGLVGIWRGRGRLADRAGEKQAKDTLKVVPVLSFTSAIPELKSTEFKHKNKTDTK